MLVIGKAEHVSLLRRTLSDTCDALASVVGSGGSVSVVVGVVVVVVAAEFATNFLTCGGKPRGGRSSNGATTSVGVPTFLLLVAVVQHEAKFLQVFAVCRAERVGFLVQESHD